MLGEPFWRSIGHYLNSKLLLGSVETRDLARPVEATGVVGWFFNGGDQGADLLSCQ
jgi:hypothetical protein